MWAGRQEWGHVFSSVPSAPGWTGVWAGSDPSARAAVPHPAAPDQTLSFVGLSCRSSCSPSAKEGMGTLQGSGRPGYIHSPRLRTPLLWWCCPRAQVTPPVRKPQALNRNGARAHASPKETDATPLLGKVRSQVSGDELSWGRGPRAKEKCLAHFVPWGRW